MTRLLLIGEVSESVYKDRMVKMDRYMDNSRKEDAFGVKERMVS